MIIALVHVEQPAPTFIKKII